MDSVCEKTPNFTLIKLSEAWQRQELGQIENSKNKKRGCAHRCVKRILVFYCAMSGLAYLRITFFLPSTITTPSLGRALSFWPCRL